MLEHSLDTQDRLRAADQLGADADCALASLADTRPRLSRVPKVFFYWLAAFYAAWALRETWIHEIVDARIGPLPRAIEAHALGLLVWALPALFVARAVFGVRFADAIRLGMPSSPSRATVAPARDRLRAWSGSLVAIALWSVGLLAFEHLTAGRHVSLDATSLSRLVASASLAPVAEELVFRGLILSVLERRLCLYRSNLITSLLFVAIYVPYWVQAAGGRPGALDDVALRALTLMALSLFLGALTLRTRSIWPAVVAHLMNNALVALLA